MRVLSDQNGVCVQVGDEANSSAPGAVTHYHIDAAQAHYDVVFPLPTTSSSPEGLSEEAWVMVLLDRVSTLVRTDPCDDFNRALYHLVKVRDCLHHHHAERTQPPRACERL